MTSRLDLARPGVRPALKARAMIAGPPGCGKTLTAMTIARELAGREFMDDGETRAVVIIDTEKESALTYADDFVFVHLPWRPPFDPTDLAHTILDAGTRHDVVVIDSGSHFWRKEGGTLDIAGGQFTGWKEARPIQDAMVDAMLECKAHVILCCRAKMAYAQERDGDKWVVHKLGVEPVQDEDVEYEVNISLTQAMDHSVTVSKSRTSALPIGKVYPAGKADEFAAAYRTWLAAGEGLADPEVVEALRARIAALPNGLRGDCRREYLATFGRPDNLTPSLAPLASDLVARYEAQVPPPPPAAEDGQESAETPAGDDAPPAPSEDAQDAETDASAAADLPPAGLHDGGSHPEDDAPPASEGPLSGVISPEGLSDDDVHQATVDELTELYGRTAHDLQAMAREDKLALGGTPHNLVLRIAQHRLANVGIHITQGALGTLAETAGLTHTGDS